METIVVLILIIGFIIINNNISSKFNRLEDTVEVLHKRIKHLQEKITTQSFISDSKKEVNIVKEPIVEKEPEPIQPEIVEEPEIIHHQEKINEPIKEILEEEVPLNISFFNDSEQGSTEKPSKQEASVPKKSWLENFKEKNPDLEKFIGENLINKIGILILVLGISFFVKYAIDKDWINEPARVGIGILCGSLVMGIAHKLKKNYASFSSVLVAGAISIFYFTIYIAFNTYGLFSQTVAFAIMSVITIFSTLISISYNRQELAILSLIGGFAAPFMVSTGEGNYIVLFTYIAILNIGILAISFFKKWKIATILDFVFTILLFSGWLFTRIEKTDFPHSGALLFATLFYFIFSITIVLNNLRNKGKFSTIEYFILIANTFYFFGIGMAILKDLDSNFTGLFTLLLAIYNIVYASILYRKFGLDKNAIYLLIGLALTFITLTIPIQFNGNQITIFWALEAVLLFWLSKKSKIGSFKIGAIIVQVLTIISLLKDWKGYSYLEQDFAIILNPLFISGFITAVSLFISYWLAKKEPNITTKFFTLDINIYTKLAFIAAIIFSYLTGILEINYQAYQFLENDYSAFSFPVTYHFIFVSILLFLSLKLKKDTIIKGALLIGCASIIFFILSLHSIPKNELINNKMLGTNTNYGFYFHYIVLGCLIYFGIELFKKTTSLFNINTKQSKWLPWVFAFAIVYVFSNEIMVHALHFSNSVDATELAENFSESQKNSFSKRNFITSKIKSTQSQIIKIGYPILWGLFSFIFLIIGIRKQWKSLRIIALSLLGLTILKLFVYDIKNVSETGKIIAFILLGVLILIISFVYQKIKKLVVEETPENTIKNEEV